MNERQKDIAKPVIVTRLWFFVVRKQQKSKQKMETIKIDCKFEIYLHYRNDFVPFRWMRIKMVYIMYLHFVCMCIKRDNISACITVLLYT